MLDWHTNSGYMIDIDIDIEFVCYFYSKTPAIVKKKSPENCSICERTNL